VHPSELAEFLTTGVAMLGASADENCVPTAFRVWGASIEATGNVRALVSCEGHGTVANLRAGSRLSLVFTDIVTFRSVQVKGTLPSAAEPADEHDVATMRRYHEAFVRALAVVGHPRALADTLRPLSVAKVSVAIDAIFDQTPGPGAGASVAVERGA
jgi:hypothetical protein